MSDTALRYVLRRIHHGESALHRDLLRLAERHHAEAEIHHVARDLARWSAESVTAIAGTGRQHDLDLGGPDAPSGPVQRLRAEVSELTKHRKEPGLLLLEDLRHIHLDAAGNGLDWELVAQYAKATRADDLLDLSRQRHPYTLRQMRWVNTMLKTLSPQVLSGL